MTKLNLLPWRETRRQEKNKEFGIAMVLAAVVAAGIGFGGFKFAEDKVAFQNKRNQKLESEIAKLQLELKEIEKLEETKNNLLARMEIIQQLQAMRPQVVHIFQEIAERLPDGVFLTAVNQQAQNQLVLEGRAESNARVSALMRRLDQSDYFTNPRLEVIEADKSDGISTFKLNLMQVVPNLTEDQNNGI